MSESENKCRHGFATSDDCCAICALEADVEATKDVLADTQTELEDLKADMETMQNISSELATDNEQLRTHLSAVQAELERAMVRDLLKVCKSINGYDQRTDAVAAGYEMALEELEFRLKEKWAENPKIGRAHV